MYKKRIGSYILEQVVIYMMVLFGFAAIALFASSLGQDVNYSNMAIIEILLIIILAILSQTIVIIRIYRHYE